MAVSYTTSDFLTAVQLRGSIPATTNTSNVNNTTNLLLLGTDELLIKLLPLLMSAREEFYVTHADYTISQNQASYPIPYRAVGQVVRDIHILNGNAVYKLAPIQREYLTTTTTGDVLGYYFEGNNIVLYPTPGSSTQGTLRVGYFRRPSQLAQTSSCAQITAVSLSTNTVTVSAYPSSWGIGTVVDFIHALPPYDCPGIDYTITGISGSNITFSSLPTDALGNSLVYANDWLALAEYTPIPQVPREFQPVLAQMVVVRVLKSQGDAAAVQMAQQELQMMQGAALGMVTQRDEGAGKKVVGRNWYRR